MAISPEKSPGHRDDTSCPCSHRHAGRHEHGLQEQPTCVVRSDVQLTASHENRLIPYDGEMRMAAPKAGSGGLRTGIWICYTTKGRGLVVLLTGVQARIETIQIAAHRCFFAVLTLSRDVNTVGSGVRE